MARATAASGASSRTTRRQRARSSPGPAKSSVPGAGGDVPLAVWGPRSDDVWAVGERGSIRRFDGTRWTSQRSPTSVHLKAVGGVGRTVWAVGAQGTVIALRR